MSFELRQISDKNKELRSLIDRTQYGFGETGKNEEDNFPFPESHRPMMDLVKAIKSFDGDYETLFLKMVNYIKDFVEKKYKGTKITIVDHASQLSDKEAIEQVTNGMVGWYSRQNDEISMVLSNVRSVADLGISLSVTNARMNFKQYLKNCDLSYEDFFKTNDYSAQVSAEIKMFYTVMSGATLIDKMFCMISKLFRNKNKTRLEFSEAEKRVIGAKLDKIRSNRIPAGGYVRYKPL